MENRKTIEDNFVSPVTIFAKKGIIVIIFTFLTLISMFLFEIRLEKFIIVREISYLLITLSLMIFSLAGILVVTIILFLVEYFTLIIHLNHLFQAQIWPTFKKSIKILKLDFGLRIFLLVFLLGYILPLFRSHLPSDVSEILYFNRDQVFDLIIVQMQKSLLSIIIILTIGFLFSAIFRNFAVHYFSEEMKLSSPFFSHETKSGKKHLLLQKMRISTYGSCIPILHIASLLWFFMLLRKIVKKFQENEC